MARPQKCRQLRDRSDGITDLSRSPGSRSRKSPSVHRGRPAGAICRYAAGVPIEIRPAVAERFDDLTRVLGPKDPEAPACWCLSYRMSSADLRLKAAQNRASVMRELCAAPVPPGVLAYLDDEVAGWCSVSPKSSYHRLVHSRVIPKVDDQPVWSVVCFVVRPGYRRQGVASALLDGAVEFARHEGATMLEGYPADNAGKRLNGAFAYTGTVSLFERAGFAMAAATTSKTGGVPRVVMRRPVA